MSLSSLIIRICRAFAASFDAEEGIRQGLEDSENGKVRPAREFFEEFEAMYGISKKPSRRRES